MLKNPLDNAGDTRDSRFDPWVGKISTGTCSSILAWKIPWTDESMERTHTAREK